MTNIEERAGSPGALPSVGGVGGTLRGPHSDRYDVVIIGGGCHGTALAYHLAKRRRQRILVLEKHYIGSGASGRNTALIRSAFNTPEWIRFFEFSRRRWEGLAAELSYNVMFTQRGYLMLAFTDETAKLCETAAAAHPRFGVRTEPVTPRRAKQLIPCLDATGLRGGLFQPGGGIARHDAVVWGFAGAAQRLGVQIRTHTEVTGIELTNGRVSGVVTSRGRIQTPCVVNAAGGHSVVVARMAGIELPLKVFRFHNLVTESVKPIIDPAVISLHNLTYGSQTGRGEFCGGSEVPEEAAFRITASLDFLTASARNLVRLFPPLAHARVLRQWAGLVDITPDFGPLLGEVPERPGLILDCGWGGYGFMATPGAGELMAEYVATGRMPEEIAPFHFRRIKDGRLIPEKSLVVVFS